MAYSQEDMQKVMNEINSGQPISISTYVGYLVDTHPNDSDLGYKIRQLIAELRKPGED
jgi:predicted ester cyclase